MTLVPVRGGSRRSLTVLCATVIVCAATPAIAAADTLDTDAAVFGATVSTKFTSPLTVQLRDAGNNPVAGVHVTFTAPVAGASATLSSTDVVTGPGGFASVTATANATVGRYQVEASAPGGLTADFLLSNAPPGFSVGEKLADIAALDENGVTRHVSDLANGGYVLLSVCTIWCSVCAEMGPGEQVVEDHLAARGVPFHVVPLLLEGSSSGTPSTTLNAKLWQTVIKFPGTVLNAGGSGLSDLYNDGFDLLGGGFPTTLVVGPDGTILDRVVGFESAGVLEARITHLINTHENYHQPAVSLTAGSGAFASAVGDLNSDGRADIATVDLNASNVAIQYRNAANDGFSTTQLVGAGNGPDGIAIGEMHSDPLQPRSLFVSNSGSDSISVIENGSGLSPTLFGEPASWLPAVTVALPAGSAPAGIATGDLNGDGLPDIATADLGQTGTGNTLSVVMRSGADTGYDPAQSIAVGGGVNDVAIGDVNGDGQPDLVATNGNDATISVVTRNAAGTGFNPHVDYPAGASPIGLALADLNGDGRLDIAVANQADDTVSVLYRNAANTGYDSPQTIAVGSTPVSVAVGDIDGDGRPDLVVANFGDDTIDILHRNAANTGYGPPETLAAGDGPDTVALGDLDANGKLDIVAPDLGDAFDGNQVTAILGGDDVGAPLTTDDVPATIVPRAPTVHLTATDTGGGLMTEPTGVDVVRYLVGPSPADPTNPANNPLTYDPAHPPVLHDGDVIRYTAVDKLGHVEAAVTSARAQVDGVAPHTSDDVPTSPVPGPVAVTLTAIDTRGSSAPGSGVAAIHYLVGADPGDPDDPANNPLTYDPANKPVLGDGQRIRYAAVDNTGNVEGAESSPVLHVGLPTVPQTSPPVTVTVTAPPPLLPAPKITKLSQTHATWRAGSASASLAKAKAKKPKPPTGTTFSFTLNVAASVSFSFTQTGHGRTTTVATLTERGAKAGVNRLAFAGRVSSSKKLKPGRYTLKLVATSGGQSSAPVGISFTISG
jgi:hypothetical protein